MNESAYHGSITHVPVPHLCWVDAIVLGLAHLLPGHVKLRALTGIQLFLQLLNALWCQVSTRFRVLNSVEDSVA